MSTTYQYSPPQPELLFDAPVPVAHRPELFVLALRTPGGVRGVDLTSSNVTDVEAAVRRAVRQNAFRWFEIENGCAGEDCMDALFANSLAKALLDRQCLDPPFTAVTDHHRTLPPLQQRWRLTGLEFNEIVGRLSYRFEPKPLPKLKLRADVVAELVASRRAAAAAAAAMSDEAGNEADEAAPAPVSPMLPREQQVADAAAMLTPAAEQYWHTVRLMQLATRARRVCAHSSLPKAVAEHHLREYTLSVQQARQIHMDATRRFLENMGGGGGGGGGGCGGAMQAQGEDAV